MKVVLLIAAVAMLTLSGCSSRGDDEPRQANVDAMYEQAQVYLRAGRFSDAAQLLQNMNVRYPFGPYSQQVQLDLIYALYKIGDQDRALSTIDRFMSLNPNHADIDYVRYMRGLVYQQAEFAIIQEFFGIDRSDRNPSYAEQAFDDFRELVRRHPDSVYAADARARMIAIKSRLAKYELSVAEYYMRRGAYLAAANRGRNVIRSFSEVPEAERALEIMVEGYRALGLDQQADDAERVLRLNFRQQS